jgi:hypothetical protein
MSIKQISKISQIVPAVMYDEDKKKIFKIIETIEKEPYSIEFQNPVDVEGLGLLDYYDYVKYPMDLGTIKKKLKESKYVMVKEALDDLQQIWTNCKIYNMEGSDIYKMAESLEKVFKKTAEKYYKLPKFPVFNSKFKYLIYLL